LATAGVGILAPLYSPDDDDAAVIVNADGSGKNVISEGVEHTFDAGTRIDFVVAA
jgi:hypothetical protein